MKWGICHRNTMAKSTHPPIDSDPCPAAQPMRGGNAPGIAPTSVAVSERRLSGV